MKRGFLLALCLFAALLMTACSGGSDVDDVPMVSQNLGPTSTPSPTPTEAPENGTGLTVGQSIFDVNPYDVADPLAEEDIDPYVEPTVAGTVYPYAGSTPIPLDPIDMPTPTPRPELTFTYVSYSSANVGVTFEGPVGWTSDESQPDIMLLSEPAAQIKEGQQCIVTLFDQPGTYNQSQLEDEVIARLDTLSSTGFSTFQRSYTATRYMMGSLGVYANYTGTLTDGTEVGGRIHYVCVDGVLYGVEIVFPLGYRDDYLNVFASVRTTISRVQ